MGDALAREGPRKPRTSLWEKSGDYVRGERETKKATHYPYLIDDRQ